jgi:hypothetical protein
MTKEIKYIQNDKIMCLVLVILANILFYKKIDILVLISINFLILFLIKKFSFIIFRPFVFIWMKLTIPLIIIISSFMSYIIYIIILSPGYVLRKIGYLSFGKYSGFQLNKNSKFIKKSDFNEEY